MTVNTDAKKTEQHMLERLGEDPLRRSREESQIIRDSITYFDRPKSIRRIKRNQLVPVPIAKDNKTEPVTQNCLPALSESLDERLYRFLNTNGEARISEIAKALKVEQNAVRAGLAELGKEGRVKAINIYLFDILATNLRKMMKSFSTNFFS